MICEYRKFLVHTPRSCGKMIFQVCLKRYGSAIMGTSLGRTDLCK